MRKISPLEEIIQLSREFAQRLCPMCSYLLFGHMYRRCHHRLPSLVISKSKVYSLLGSATFKRHKTQKIVIVARVAPKIYVLIYIRVFG